MADDDNKSEERKFSQEQYDMLKRCSVAKNMSEWNNWRNKNPHKEVLLEGADFTCAYLKKVNLGAVQLVGSKTTEVNLQKAVFLEANLDFANLEFAHLEHANLQWASLSDAMLMDAHLENATLWFAHLEGADISGAYLQNTDLRSAHLDGCHSGYEPGQKLYINQNTDIRGVDLSKVWIDPGTKQLLEYNVRRRNWNGWYKGKSNKTWKQKSCQFLTFPIHLFWLMSDYGRSILRIAISFSLLAILFALVYLKWPTFIAFNGKAEIETFQNFWHALYFSVVTMTTLGFGDIAANPYSRAGQTLLMIQVILGYVMLGALITRFAVLFTAGGPSGKFSKIKEKQ